MNEFNIPTSTVQWVTTINLLMLAIIIPTSSWLKKCFKTKTLFAAALIVFAAGTLLGMWSPNFPTLMAARALQGIGTGMVLPMMSNIIMEQAPNKYTGTLMGIVGMIIVLGPALGPALGGLIIEMAGWRMIFGFVLPFIVIAAIAGLICIRQSSAIAREPFDLKGFVLLAVGFICIIVPLSNISHWGFANPAVWIMIVLAVIFLTIFTKHCGKRDEPLLKVSILRTPCFTFCMTALLLCQFITLARGFMIPNLFQLSSGLSAFTAGCIVLPACLISACMNPFTGRIYDTLGPKLPITLGFIMILADIALETLLMVHVSHYVMMGIAIIYCVGQSFSTGNTTTFALRNLPGNLYADGTAIINSLQQLFGAIGTAAASALVSLGQAAHPDDIATGTSLGTQWALYLLFILAVVMFLCAMKGLRSSKQTR